MLLKDGVKYFPYEYSSEKELEKMVIEHYKEIFGNDTLFFDPQIMTNNIGVTQKRWLNTRFERKQWFIRIELAQHSIYLSI